MLGFMRSDFETGLYAVAAKGKAALREVKRILKDDGCFICSFPMDPGIELLDEDPGLKDLYSMGTVVRVKQILKSQGENIRILVSGLHRARILTMTQTEPYLAGEIEAVEDSLWSDNLRTVALRREANSLFSSYLDYAEKPAQAVVLRMMASDDCGFIADSIAQNTSLDYRDKAKILCQLNPVRRLESVIMMLRHETQVMQMEAEIQEKTRAYIDQEQRDYFLREQMKVIRDELGEGESQSEFLEYEQRIMALHLPEESEKKVLKDLERLQKQPFGSAEASVLRNYLDTLLELPWNQSTKERIDVEAAKKILNKDHFGLDKGSESAW